MDHRRRWRSAAVTAGILLVALGMSVVVAVLGPEAMVVCGTGHVLNRLAQGVMQPLGAGHIDSATASYCVVPSTVAWLMSTVVLLGVLAVGLVVSRRWGAWSPARRSIRS